MKNLDLVEEGSVMIEWISLIYLICLLLLILLLILIEEESFEDVVVLLLEEKCKMWE